MKNLTTILLTATAILTAIPVSAEEYTAARLNINGEEIVCDQPPIIINSRTMVPVRVVGETLGAEVEWNSTTKTATFKNDTVTATIGIGESSVLYQTEAGNGEYSLDTPAEIINSRTLVPIRAISEVFGYPVEWDGATKTVIITTITDEELEEQIYLKKTAEEIKSYSKVLQKEFDKLEPQIGTLTPAEFSIIANLNFDIADVNKILESGDYDRETLDKAMERLQEREKMVDKIIEDNHLKI